MDDVGSGVPVGKMLGIFRAQHDAMPELDSASGANRRAAHQVKGERRKGDDRASNADSTGRIGYNGLL